ncbi:MAG: EamA family transporter [Actinomycetota bacterium]
MDRLGFAAVSGAAALWAFGGTYARTLIDDGASALEITEARAWIAFLALGAWTLWRSRRGRDATASRERCPAWIVVLFGLSLAAANYFYYSAVGSLPVAVAIVIQYTAPGLVVLWLAFASRRRPSSRVVLSLVAALGGVALLSELPDVISGSGTSLSSRGVAAAIASAFAFAAYIITGEHVERAAGPVGSLVRGFGIASVLWIVIQATRGRPDTLFDGSLLPGVILLGIVATIIPFSLFLWGLARIGPSRAGIVSTLEPLSAAFLAYFWLDQSLSGIQIAGAALVVVGIAVIQSERAETAPTPAPVD